MLHLDRGGDNLGARAFFNEVRARDIRFDVIGLSNYPWWHGPMTALKANVEDLAIRYRFPIVVVETAYP